MSSTFDHQQSSKIGTEGEGRFQCDTPGFSGPLTFIPGERLLDE